MPNFPRTDLAVEAEAIHRSAAAVTELPGVRAEETNRRGFSVTEVHVLDAAGENALCKPIGDYYTIALDPLLRREDDAFENAAQTLAEVEDLYRPYKPKRRTRATVAKEKGLEPLAALLFAQERDCPRPEEAAADYLSAEKGVETVADALQGANDIVAEWISDDAAIRRSLRELLEKRGTLRSLAATEEDSVYRLYYDFEQPLSRLQGHQILAINRGEKEKMLSATVLLERELALPLLRRLSSAQRSTDLFRSRSGEPDADKPAAACAATQCPHGEKIGCGGRNRAQSPRAA